ncbi:MAG: NAD(P)-dependent oxidoreductase [Pseudomonadota bacterium]
MNVLVTGYRGKLGAAVFRKLEAEGVGLRGYDLSDGQDLLDASSLRAACEGMDAVAHCAGIPRRMAGWWTLMRVNVQGVARLLAAAQQAGVQRLVHGGSIHAMGIFLGEGRPDYFPLDTAHPRRPRSAYALSRALAETVCARSTAGGGPSTVCLRFPALLTTAELDARRADLLKHPHHEGASWWDYGAFIHLEDAAEALCRALRAPLQGHHRLMVCADEIAAVEGDSLAFLRRYYPRVPLRDPGYFESPKDRPLLDCEPAKQLLAWRPLHGWRDGA